MQTNINNDILFDDLAAIGQHATNPAVMNVGAYDDCSNYKQLYQNAEVLNPNCDCSN